MGRRLATVCLEPLEVRRLPVLDERRHLQGVISIDDILRLPQRRGVPYPEVILEALRAIVSRPTAADLHR